MGLMKMSGDLYNFEEDAKLAGVRGSVTSEPVAPNELKEPQLPDVSQPLQPVDNRLATGGLKPPPPVPSIKEPKDPYDADTPKSLPPINRTLPVKTSLASHSGDKMDKLRRALNLTKQAAMTESDYYREMVGDDPEASMGFETPTDPYLMENFDAQPDEYSNYMLAQQNPLGEVSSYDMPEDTSQDYMGYSPYDTGSYDTMGYSPYELYDMQYASPEGAGAEYADIQTQAVEPEPEQQEQQMYQEQQQVYDDSFNEIYQYLVQMGYTPEEATAAVPSLLSQVNVSAPQAPEAAVPVKTARYAFNKVASDLASGYINSGYSPYQAREMAITIVIPQVEKYAELVESHIPAESNLGRNIALGLGGGALVAAGHYGGKALGLGPDVGRNTAYGLGGVAAGATAGHYLGKALGLEPLINAGTGGVAGLFGGGYLESKIHGKTPAQKKLERTMEAERDLILGRGTPEKNIEVLKGEPIYSSPEAQQQLKEKYASVSRLVGGLVGGTAGGLGASARYDDEGEYGGAVGGALIGGALGAFGGGRVPKYFKGQYRHNSGVGKDLLTARRKELVGMQDDILKEQQSFASSLGHSDKKTFLDIKGALSSSQKSDPRWTGSIDRWNAAKNELKEIARTPETAIKEIARETANKALVSDMQRLGMGAAAAAIPGVMVDRALRNVGGDNIVDKTFEGVEHVGDKTEDALQWLKDNPEYLYAAGGIGAGSLAAAQGYQYGQRQKAQRAGKKKGRTKKSQLEISLRLEKTAANALSIVLSGLYGLNR